jgi:hypothetical protein
MQSASVQPASKGKIVRSRRVQTKHVRSENPPIAKNRTEPLTIHCEPGVKERLRELAAGAKNKKLATLSGITNALIKRALTLDPDKPYGPTLEPVVQGAIRTGFSRHDNRLAPLQARSTRDSAETRHLMANAVSLLLQILGKQEEVAPGAFERIIAETEKKGREALTRPDPWLLQIVHETYARRTGEGEGAR